MTAEAKQDDVQWDRLTSPSPRHLPGIHAHTHTHTPHAKLTHVRSVDEPDPGAERSGHGRHRLLVRRLATGCAVGPVLVHAAAPGAEDDTRDTRSAGQPDRGGGRREYGPREAVRQGRRQSGVSRLGQEGVQNLPELLAMQAAFGCRESSRKVGVTDEGVAPCFPGRLPELSGVLYIEKHYSLHEAGVVRLDAIDHVLDQVRFPSSIVMGCTRRCPLQCPQG